MRIEDRIVASLLAVGAVLIKEGNRVVAEFGINQQQFVTLRYIMEHGPVNQRTICSRLLFEKSHVSKVVKKLANQGLVEIFADEGDSRITLIVVTDRGRELVEKAMAKLQDWNSGWLSSLSETEKLHAELALDKLSQIE